MELTEDQLAKLETTPEEFKSLTPEEQTALLKDAGFAPKEPEPKDDEKLRGVLADLQSEREKRQQVEAKLDDTNAQLAAMQEQLAGLKGRNQDEEIQLDDGDVLTVAQARKLLNQETKALLERIDTTEQGAWQRTVAESEARAREKYSEDKVGKDFTYDEALAAFQEIARKNPGYKEAARNAEDVAEEVYRIGLTHPKFRDKVRSKTAQEVVDKINAPRPKTGGGQVGGAGSVDPNNMTTEQLMKLSDEELDKLLKQNG